MMTKQLLTRLKPIVVSTSKSSPSGRFAEIKSLLLDREAMLEELLASQANENTACDDVWSWPKASRREGDQWKILDEDWLQLRPLLEYTWFAELEAAFFAAHADARKHPRTWHAKDRLIRLKVLWLACVDNTRPTELSAAKPDTGR